MATSASALDWRGSGFLTLATARVLGGSHHAEVDNDWRCPCFIADYSQAGVYESDRWQLGPSSKLGLQGQVSSDDGRYSLTGQVVARGARQGRANLEWLYASADLGRGWTVHLGRQRLPIFMSSDIQDVGIALPWMHLPPQLYGWEVVNFNGATLQGSQTVGAWLFDAQLFAGSEQRNDSHYQSLFVGKHTVTDVRWSGLRGLVLKAGYGGWEARLMMLGSKTALRDGSSGEQRFSSTGPQHLAGLSLSTDQGRWFARAEWLRLSRSESDGLAHAGLVAAGGRHGPWQLTLTRATFRQSVAITPGFPLERHGTLGLALRRELSTSSAVKLQFDAWRDRSDQGLPFQHGNSRLLGLAYDRVF